jgi:thiamine pyrophosphate-dependent acetolactate synthase large subunit-like protein
MPYAVAATVAFPERVLVAMVGDGAMQMNVTTNESAPSPCPKRRGGRLTSKGKP